MGASRFIVSHANAARLELAKAELLAHRDREVLIIGASRRAADDFARFACGASGGVAGAHRTTLLQLAAELSTLSLAREQRGAMSSLGVEALVARSVHRALSTKPLEYFQPVAETPGFARALAATLSELRLENVDRSRLEAVGPAGRDLYTLGEIYDDELAKKLLADPAHLLRLAKEVARTESSRWLGLPLILLDVAPRYALEAELVATIASRASSCLAVLHAHDLRGIAAMEEALGVQAEAHAEPAIKTALQRAQRYVFATNNLGAQPEPAGIEFFSAPGEGRECVEIARRILSAAEKGSTFDRIAVLLRSPDVYQPLIEDALTRAAIPAFYTRGTVRPDPSGRALLALLACRAEGLSAVRFAEYLSLGQVPAVDDSGAPRARGVPWVASKNEAQLAFKTLIDDPPELEEEDNEIPHEGSAVVHGTLRAPFQWERLLVEASVVEGGADRWARRLDGLRAELELRYRGLSEDDEGERDRLRSELDRLLHLQKFALPVIGFLDRLPRTATWGEWIEHLTALCALALRRTNGALAVLAELRPMSEVGPVGLDEVRAVLAERLTLLRSDPPVRRYGRVFVGRVDEAAGRSFDLVFLPGLAEGIFPKKAFEDPLLLDIHRREVSPRLRVREHRSQDERLLLSLALGAARVTLFASYPRMEAAEGKPRVPSFYALDLLRAAEGALPDVRELERRAASSASARLGWPAPKHPTEAIDDAEYDLAVLDPLLSLRSEDETLRSRARYLMTVNPHLSRSLRMEAGRGRNKWKHGDGLVERDDATRARLSKHAPSQRIYAATDLEGFSRCPYQFLLRSVHRLRPRQTPVKLEELDPQTRGTLFHHLLFRAFGALKVAKLWPMEQRTYAEIIELMDRLLDSMKAEWAETLVPAIPRVFDREMELLRKDLYGWVQASIAHDKEWEPIHAELSFGEGAKRRGEADPKSRFEPVSILGRYLVRGRIDLVEKHRVFGYLRATDYKTGRFPDPAPEFIGGGQYLQPMIYALAAEQILEGGSASSGSLFYCTARTNYQRVEIDVTTESRAALSEAFETIERSIEEGFLPAAPRAEACGTCDFRAACSSDEEEKSGRKDKEPLARLLRLRTFR